MGLAEFMRVFGIDRTTAWRWHVTKYGPRRLPGRNTGARVRYLRDAVEKWIEKQAKTDASPVTEARARESARPSEIARAKAGVKPKSRVRATSVAKPNHSARAVERAKPNTLARANKRVKPQI
jgi:predicted DNA-binding transcriptional regulator AlpA